MLLDGLAFAVCPPDWKVCFCFGRLRALSICPMLFYSVAGKPQPWRRVSSSAVIRLKGSVWKCGPIKSADTAMSGMASLRLVELCNRPVHPLSPVDKPGAAAWMNGKTVSPAAATPKSRGGSLHPSLSGNHDAFIYLLSKYILRPYLSYSPTRINHMTAHPIPYIALSTFLFTANQSARRSANSYTSSARKMP